MIRSIQPTRRTAMRARRRMAAADALKVRRKFSTGFEARSAREPSRAACDAGPTHQRC